MKKKMYFLLLAVLMAISSFSQTNVTTFPYSQDFENTTNVGEWHFYSTNTQGWFIGNATGNTGNSMYISDSNGTSNTYDNGTANTSAAYVTVTFGSAGEYDLSFDWKSEGESNTWDRCQVYALSDTATLSSWLSSMSNSMAAPSNGVVLFPRLCLQGTTWQHSAIILPDSFANTTKTLVFVWYNDNGGGSNPPAAIDNVSIVGTDCVKPTNLTASNTTTTGFDLGWTDPTGSTWNIDYRLATDTTWTSLTGITTNPYTFSGLTASSAYQIRVQTDCGAEQSAWSSVLTARTACDVVSTLPWHEYFNSDWVSGNGLSNQPAPPCWTNLDGGAVYTYTWNTYSWVHGTYNSHDSVGGDASIYTDYATSAHNDWLITPQLALTGNQRVSFYAMNNSASTDEQDEISVWISDSTIDSTGLAAGDSLPGFHQLMQTTIPVGTWQRYEVNLTSYPAGNYYIAFVRRNTPYDGYYLNLDDITVDDVPSCPEVFGTALVSTSPTSMKVNFNAANSNGSGWNIVYDTSSTFNPATSTNTPINITDASQLPYDITGLTAGATYYVSVQQNCSGPWSTLVHLTLQDTSVTVPYIQPFTDTANVREYAYLNSDTTNIWYIGTAIDADSTSTTRGAMYITNDHGVSNTGTLASDWSTIHLNYSILNVNFPQGNQFNIDFDYRNNAGALNVYLVDADYNVLTSSTPSGNGVVSLGSYTNIATWQHETIVLNSSYANTFKKLVFCWYDQYWSDNNQPPAAIDNLNISIATCGLQTNLALVSKDTTSAHISWHDANNAGNYIVRYKEAGATSWQEMNTTDTLATITGLTSGTQYDVKVAALCSSTDTSLFTSSIDFWTDCAFNIPPYLEAFDNDVTDSPCWTRAEGTLGATTTLIGTYSSWYYNSNGSMYINIYGTTRHEWLITPTIDLGTDGTTYQVEFDAKLTAYSGSVAGTTATDDKFAVVISRDNGTTWSNANAYIWSCDSNATRNYHSFNATPTHVIIPLYDSVNSVAISGAIKIGFYGESTMNNDDNNFYIDNLAVNPWSDCQRPTAVTVSNFTQAEATISFTENGTATAWEYVIGDSTMDPATATAVSSSTNPIVISNLTPATQYYVAVRSACSSNSSLWSDIVSFKTLAEPATLPYTCDFENTTENANWMFVQNGQKNKWYIGADTANSVNNTANGANGLYVSNDGGHTYAYSLNTYSEGDAICYAFRDIIVPDNATQIALSVDWKAQGYNPTGDFLRFYVVNPDSTTITAGQVLSGNLDASAQIGYPTNGEHWLSQHNTWQNKNFVIDVAQYPFMTPGDTIRLLIQWRVVNHYSIAQPPAAVDNISIAALTCTLPSNLSAISTTTTATATWSGTASNYEVVLYNNDTTITDYSTDTTYTFNGLTASTLYNVKVRSICGAGDTSFFSNVVSVRTSCYDAAISTFPWAEGFENGLNCWTLTASGTNWQTETIGSNPTCSPIEGTNMIRFNSYSMDAGEWATAISPALDFSQDMKVTFNIYKNSDYEIDSDRVVVYVNSTASETGATVVDSVLRYRDTDGWDTVSFHLPTGLTGTQYIILKGVSGYGSNIFVDNLIVDTVDNGTALTEPTVVTTAATSVAQTTATFNGTITDGTNPVTARGFEYKQTVAGAYLAPVTATGTSSITYNATGLLANTQYTYRAYATTAAGTVYGDTITFTTLADTTPSTVTPPTVVTVAASGIAATSAVLNGTVTAGTHAITAQGFQWKATNGGTYATVNGTISGTTLSATITNLTAATGYTYRAFATTADTTVYGVEKTFTTLNSIADVNGNEFSVKLYPNPTEGDATLSVEGLNENATVVMTDVQGRVISSEKIAAGQKTLTIRRNNISSGVYYIRVISNEATRTEKLIVK